MRATFRTFDFSHVPITQIRYVAVIPRPNILARTTCKIWTENQIAKALNIQTKGEKEDLNLIPQRASLSRYKRAVTLHEHILSRGQRGPTTWQRCHFVQGTKLVSFPLSFLQLRVVLTMVRPTACTGRMPAVVSTNST